MLVYIAGYKINGARLELGLCLFLLWPLTKLHNIQQCPKFDVVSVSSIYRSKLVKPDELNPAFSCKGGGREFSKTLHWDGRRAVESVMNGHVNLNGIGEK